MTVGVKSLHLLAQFILTLWLLAKTQSQVDIIKEPSSLLIPADKIGVFSCKAQCNGFPSCSGYWIINGTSRYTISQPRMNTNIGRQRYTNESGFMYTLTLTVNASEAINDTSIKCRYEANGDHNGSDESEPVFLFISSPPMSGNVFISKNATHVTLTWSPPFLWPGQRIQCYNISVSTNRNDEISAHHMVNSSFLYATVSFSLNMSYFLQSNSLTCVEVLFRVSPVTESAPKLIMDVTLSDWMWNLPPIVEKLIVNASVLFKADRTPAMVQIYAQLPSSNCSYKDLNYTLVVENKWGDVLAEVDTFPSLDSDVIKENLAVDLIENKEYFVQIQITVHSQTIASQKYIFSTLQNVSSCNLMCNISNAVEVPTRNSSVQVYVALTGLFVASTILLLVTLVLVVMLLFIDYKKGIRGMWLSKPEKKVSKVMVTNPIYEGDEPMYESLQFQHERNSVTVTESNMPQPVPRANGENDNFYQASDGSNTCTPTDTPTSETMPLTAPRVMALKKNGQERNKLHLSLSLGGGNNSTKNPTVANETARESVATRCDSIADEVYIEMSPAGVQCHSLNPE